jgi:hypothetical protein
MIVFMIARLSCHVAKFRFKNIGNARRIKSVFSYLMSGRINIMESRSCVCVSSV